MAWVWLESDFNPNAISYAGGVGYGQVLSKDGYCNWLTRLCNARKVKNPNDACIPCTDFNDPMQNPIDLLHN